MAGADQMNNGTPQFEGASLSGAGIIESGTSAAAELIEGYCWPLSAAAGDTVRFFISTSAPSYEVSIRDISREVDKEIAGLLPSTLPGMKQKIPGVERTPEALDLNLPIPPDGIPDAAVNGCGW